MGGAKAAILAQVGQFYSDAVGQYHSGANTCEVNEGRSKVSQSLGSQMATPPVGSR